MTVEKFIDTYVKCRRCGYNLHIYCYPYIDKTRTKRDLTVCLMCKQKDKQS